MERKLGDYVIDELDLHKEGAILETNRPYLILLKESLNLPLGMRAKANPKSSTGRIDVFTRVITDRGAPVRRNRARVIKVPSISRWCRSRSPCGCGRT